MAENDKGALSWRPSSAVIGSSAFRPERSAISWRVDAHHDSGLEELAESTSSARHVSTVMSTHAAAAGIVQGIGTKPETTAPMMAMTMPQPMIASRRS